MLLIFGLVFVFTACEEKDDSGYDPNDVDETEVEEEYEDTSNTLDLISRSTWTTEDSKGYKIQGEVKTTDLMRASDWSTVESTFNSLSSADPLSGFEAVAPDGANQDTAAVLVGKIKLINITDGWDFSESSPYEYKIHFDAPDLIGYNASSLCVMYGTGLKKYAFGGVEGLDTSMVMVANDGAVLFIIVIPETFTPNEPNGSESVLNATLRVISGTDGCEFTMPGLAG